MRDGPDSGRAGGSQGLTERFGDELLLVITRLARQVGARTPGALPPLQLAVLRRLTGADQAPHTSELAVARGSAWRR